MATNITNTAFICADKTRYSQMSSCEEAKFYLTRCSVRSLDKDGNGVPCEVLSKCQPWREIVAKWAI